MKVCQQHRVGGFCKKCRKKIRRGRTVVVVRGRPYCEECAAKLRQT